MLDELVVGEAKSRIRTLRAQLSVINEDREANRAEWTELLRKTERVQALIDGYTALLEDAGIAVEV